MLKTDTKINRAVIKAWVKFGLHVQYRNPQLNSAWTNETKRSFQHCPLYKHQHLEYRLDPEYSTPTGEIERGRPADPQSSEPRP